MHILTSLLCILTQLVSPVINVCFYFQAGYLNCPLPYVRCHITVKTNVLSASLNKTFLCFVPGRQFGEVVFDWLRDTRVLTQDADIDCDLLPCLPEIKTQLGISM